MNKVDERKRETKEKERKEEGTNADRVMGRVPYRFQGATRREGGIAATSSKQSKEKKTNAREELRAQLGSPGF